MAAESEAFIASISSPTFDEEDNPVFQVLNFYIRTNLNSSIERQTHKSDIRIELNKYLSTAFASRNTKILEWLGPMANTYPSLAKLARKDPCISVSSSTLEKNFSGSGNTVTCKQINLHVSNVEKLVYVRENFDNL